MTSTTNSSSNITLVKLYETGQALVQQVLGTHHNVDQNIGVPKTLDRDSILVIYGKREEQGSHLKWTIHEGSEYIEDKYLIEQRELLDFLKKKDTEVSVTTQHQPNIGYKGFVKYFNLQNREIIIRKFESETSHTLLTNLESINFEVPLKEKPSSSTSFAVDNTANTIVEKNNNNKNIRIMGTHLFIEKPLGTSAVLSYLVNGISSNISYTFFLNSSATKLMSGEAKLSLKNRTDFDFDNVNLEMVIGELGKASSVNDRSGGNRGYVGFESSASSYGGVQIQGGGHRDFGSSGSQLPLATGSTFTVPIPGEHKLKRNLHHEIIMLKIRDLELVPQYRFTLEKQNSKAIWGITFKSPYVLPSGNVTVYRQPGLNNNNNNNNSTISMETDIDNKEYKENKQNIYTHPEYCGSANIPSSILEGAKHTLWLGKSQELRMEVISFTSKNINMKKKQKTIPLKETELEAESKTNKELIINDNDEYEIVEENQQQDFNHNIDFKRNISKNYRIKTVIQFESYLYVGSNFSSSSKVQFLSHYRNQIDINEKHKVSVITNGDKENVSDFTGTCMFKIGDELGNPARWTFLGIQPGTLLKFSTTLEFFD